MQRLSGIHPVIPTPYTDDFQVDEKGLVSILDHVAAAPVQGVWLGGAGAEFTNLTEQQRRQIMRVCREQLKGHLDLVWGVGDCSLDEAVRRAHDAAEHGMDAIHSVEPYFYTLGTDELRRYFLGLADRSKLPLVIYFHPGRWTKTPSGAPSPTSVLAELARHENIVGVKYSCVDFRDFQRVLFAVRSDSFSVMTSAGRLLLASLAVGADGGVFHEAVVAPHLYSELYEAATHGRSQRALELQRALAPLGDVMAVRDHSAAKTALHMMGRCQPTMSPPHLPMNAGEAEAVAAVLTDLGLLARQAIAAAS